jgi:hypothetical protein
VYPVEEPNVYREAAARCRKAARSSSDSKEWIALAEQWEWLADTANGLWILPSRARNSHEQLLDLSGCERVTGERGGAVSHSADAK